MGAEVGAALGAALGAADGEVVTDGEDEHAAANTTITVTRANTRDLIGLLLRAHANRRHRGTAVAAV